MTKKEFRNVNLNEVSKEMKKKFIPEKMDEDFFKDFGTRKNGRPVVMNFVYQKKGD